MVWYLITGGSGDYRVASGAKPSNDLKAVELSHKRLAEHIFSITMCTTSFRTRFRYSPLIVTLLQDTFRMRIFSSSPKFAMVSLLNRAFFVLHLFP